MPVHRSMLCLCILTFLVLTSCQSSTVTYNGKEVTNQTIITATKAVHVAELAAVAVSDTLTTEFKAGRVKAEVLQQFQQQIAPKVSAALSTAKIALATFEKAPETTPVVTVMQAVLALQDELSVLQGFWITNLPQGGRP